MANTKISQLPSATTPVVGTEVLPIVQSSATSKVSIANLTAGRAVSASSYEPTGSTAPTNGMYLPSANTLSISTNGIRTATFTNINNFDVGTNNPAAAQRFIQAVNTSSDPLAAASVAAKSDAQLLQITANSSTTAAISGITQAGKALLYAAGGSGSSGLQIWDASTTPQIDFILSTKIISTFSTAGNLDVGSSNSANTARFIRVKNDSTGSSAYATTTAQSDVQIASLQAYSSTYPAVSGITVAGKAVFYAAGGAGSSGLQIWDNSAAPQLDFIIGTKVVGTFSNGFNLDVGTGSNANTSRYVRAVNTNTGSSAFASVYSQSDTQIAQLQAYSSTYPSVSGITVAGKSALYSSGSGAGLLVWDNSTTPQIDFVVGAGVLAGTINSSGNWNFNTKTISGIGALTANSFIPNGSSVPTNGMYLPSANTVSISTNSAVAATFTSTGNFDVGTGNTTNTARFIRAVNASAGSSAYSTVTAQSNVQLAQLQAYSSTYPAASGITLAGKAVVYAAGTGSTGLTFWDSSDTPGMQFVVGTTSAGTINSSAVLTLANNPILTSGTANGVAYLNGSKQLTTGTDLVFTSTGLGIGASSPAYKLQVTGTGGTINTSVGTNATSFRFLSANTTSEWTFGNNSTGIQNSGDYFAWNRLPNGGSWSELMRLDSSGNLGLGVTPKAWVGAKAVSVNSAGSVYADGLVYGWNTGIAANCYRTGNSTWAYQNAGVRATRIEANESNPFTVYLSGVGTNANDPVTFTQAMTLDANGVLLVGTTSTSGGAQVTFNNPNAAAMKVAVTASTGTYAAFQSFVNSTVTVVGTDNSAGGYLASGSSPYATVLSNTGAYPIQFGTNNTIRATIDSSGRLLVGTNTAAGSASTFYSGTAGQQPVSMWNGATSGNNYFFEFGTEGTYTARGSITYNRAGGLTVYNTTSDYRAKDIYGSITDSGSVIDSTPVYMGKMKGATQERPMFIAHETPDYAHTGEKDAVDADGNPVYQQMDASALVPVLWAEVQSLRKRLAALESK